MLSPSLTHAWLICKLYASSAVSTAFCVSTSSMIVLIGTMVYPGVRVGAAERLLTQALDPTRKSLEHFDGSPPLHCTGCSFRYCAYFGSNGSLCPPRCVDSVKSDCAPVCGIDSAVIGTECSSDQHACVWSAG
jgi:hypothetical protein